MDNFKTLDASAFYETFVPEEANYLWDRFEFIFTPKHGSWLNNAEIELHVLNGQCLNRHTPTIEEITSEVDTWKNHRNNKTVKLNISLQTTRCGSKLKDFIRQFQINSTLAEHTLLNIPHYIQQEGSERGK
jgi:hypothetical protein